MSKIDLNDPRLTAYALNEMKPAELAEFEQSLAEDAAAREAVAEIRATVATLTSALENEPAEPAPIPSIRHDTYAKVIRFPYWKISGLAAACFAMIFIYWQRRELMTVQRHYIELPLTTGDQAANSPITPTGTPIAGSGGSADAAKRDESKAKVLANEVQQRRAKEQLVAGQKDDFKGMREAVATASSSLPATLAAQSSVPPPPVAEMLPENVPASSVAKRSYAAQDLISLQAVSAPASSGYLAKSTLAATRVQAPVNAEEAGAAVGGAQRGNATFGALRQGPGLESNTETYAFRKDSSFIRVSDQPLSTFAADVDTASYTNVRRFLMQGQRPPIDAVRIEEMINYFPYSYAGPEVKVGRVPAPAKELDAQGDGTPSTQEKTPAFAAHLEVASAPWAPEHRLVRIGIKGREVSDDARSAANLVFLLDVSGSMSAPNRLPLVKQSLRLLVGKLRPDDRVAIAVYAGASGLVLPSTAAAHQAQILDAIDRLEAEGSTNGEAGIQLAYDIAKANFIPSGVNRVILATDGDFNVGVTSEGELVRLIGEKAKSGVFLTVLGYGMGNVKDATLEQLADKGNGNYAYIDSLAEAKKVLVEQTGGTLVTIAKDVKLQVEFNPAEVQAYRLIGYENRLLAKEDFNNDQVDAGEIGAGHTVTVLYEVVPTGTAMPQAAPGVDALKYAVPQTSNAKRQTPSSSEMLTVKIRYKEPAGDVSSKLEFALSDSGKRFDEASQDFKFAAAVAAFGMALRNSPDKGSTTIQEVQAWGRAGLGSDPGGYRSEFLGLVERAQALLQ